MTVRQTDEKTIHIGDKSITFDVPVREFLELSDRVLVRVSNFTWPETDPDFGRNIFAYDLDGNALWRVEDARVMVGGRTVDEVSQGYMAFQRGDDGKIYVWILDYRFDLDPETGKVSNEKYFR